MSDERTNSNTTDSNDEVLQWVTYRLGEETYGINVMQVQEVLRYTEIAPVPGAPDYVLGIINLRGNVVTVIDTRARFGLPPTEITDNTRIVIIESDEQVVGILLIAWLRWFTFARLKLTVRQTWVLKKVLSLSKV